MRFLVCLKDGKQFIGERNIFQFFLESTGFRDYRVIKVLSTGDGITASQRMFGEGDRVNIPTSSINFIIKQKGGK